MLNSNVRLSILLIPLFLSISSSCQKRGNSSERIVKQNEFTDDAKIVMVERDTVIYEFDSSIYESGSKFKTDQLKKQRVKTAYKDKGQVVLSLIKQNDIQLENLVIFIRIFKKEEVLEVWGKNLQDETFKLLVKYSFSANSGVLGPKRHEGDYQIPEGFYHINVFNPYSSFYLSLGINYPNRSDRILGVKGNLGGEIFLHGSEVTIGCVPITDDKIKELYIFAVEAKNNGQLKIPVHIFPTYLTNEKLTGLVNDYADDEQLIDFWKNISTGYTYFAKTKTLPAIRVLENGKYIFNE